MLIVFLISIISLILRAKIFSNFFELNKYWTGLFFWKNSERIYRNCRVFVKTRIPQKRRYGRSPCTYSIKSIARKLAEGSKEGRRTILYNGVPRWGQDKCTPNRMRFRSRLAFEEKTNVIKAAFIGHIWCDLDRRFAISFRGPYTRRIAQNDCGSS